MERLFEKSKPGAIANSAAQIALARANLDALTTVIRLPAKTYATRDQRVAFHEQLKARLQTAYRNCLDSRSNLKKKIMQCQLRR